MKAMSSRQVIKRLKKDGWFMVKKGKGDHQNFKHSDKKGKITVPHPNKDIPKDTLRSIYRMAGWNKNS